MISIEFDYSLISLLRSGSFMSSNCLCLSLFFLALNPKTGDHIPIKEYDGEVEEYYIELTDKT
jgi:hypothetical protein